MSHSHSARHDYADDDEDDLEQFEQDENSFEGGNQIFELRSQVNSLKIQKNKLMLEHQSVMASIESKNQQLTQSNNQLRRENNSLNSRLKGLEEDYEELKKTHDQLKIHFESISRKTADFHRSVDDRHTSLGDPSDIINDLLEKDKVIEELTKQVEYYKVLQNPKSSHEIPEGMSEEEREKLEADIKTLKQTVEDLKRKEIVYKREYEGMLQSKEEIIKKMSSQNEDYSKKITDAKDKIINQLRKELEDSVRRADEFKQENKASNERLAIAEAEHNKLKTQFRKKEERFLQSKQIEKEDLTKVMNDKLKKHLLEKEDKLSKSEDKIYELQNQILILRQQIGKQKAELTSRQQFTSYLETSNKQYEQSKKKLQNFLYERQRELGEQRQKYYAEIAELNTSIIQERAALEQRICQLEEQVIVHRMQSQKFQEELKQYQRSEFQERNKNNYVNNKECEKLRREKDDLNEELLSLQERYKEKSEKMLNLEKKIRKEYEDRVGNLETELIKERERARQQKQGRIEETVAKKSILESELQKLKNVLELVQIDKNQIESELKRSKEEKLTADKERMEATTKVRDIQRKLKEKEEDLRYLEISYEELKEKYRKGVKDLEDQISDMTKQFQEERRKAERRKNQSQDSESTLHIQVKSYKARILELESELDNIKTNKIQDAQYTDLKLQKLANELAIITKEKDTALKMNGRLSKDKEEVYETEKKKLMEYIGQLQENNEILNKKLDMTETKDRSSLSGFQKQLRSLKVEYSESLKETNMLLQKYKKLQEVHQEALAQIEYIRVDHDKLNKKYLEIYRQKNKLCDQLNASYDQINKLNMVLMSKQEQISRTKTIHCPHFDKSPPVYSSTSNIYAPNSHNRNRSPLSKVQSSFYRKSNHYN